MPPNLRRVPLAQMGGTKGTKPKGETLTKAQKKRRKTDQAIKKKEGKGPSDNRHNTKRDLPGTENR